MERLKIAGGAVVEEQLGCACEPPGLSSRLFLIISEGIDPQLAGKNGTSHLLEDKRAAADVWRSETRAVRGKSAGARAFQGASVADP